MRLFKADLHIHTVLSPCGDLMMSPANIVQQALKQQLDIIGITDHNSTRQCRAVAEEAIKAGLMVFTGAEVTTKEEVHCLAFFDTFDHLDAFQSYLDLHLPYIKNDPDLFGYQVVVNAAEEIVFEEERLLISGINKGIDEVEREVHRLKGLFIPAHINRPKYSLTSQLGFVPPDLKADAFELTKHISTDEFIRNFPYMKNRTFIRNSDAHQPEDIGTTFTEYKMEAATFEEFSMALHRIEGREAMAL